MDSIYLLLPIALIFTAMAIKAFFWAVNNHQYDDLDTPGNSILLDDDEPITDQHSKENNQRAGGNDAS